MDQMYKHQLVNKGILCTEVVNLLDAMSDNDIHREIKALCRPGAATAAINYYRNMFNGTRVLTRTKITVPTLVLWGERDMALGKQLTLELDKYVEKIVVKYFPNASHW